MLATSEGNPLFVAELVRMLVQDGTLVREGDRWITSVEISKLDMPPTIQVLLAARIERLRPEERAVLERAAVIGRHFSRAGVAHLLPRGTADLDARLEALRRSDLIEPDTGWFLGEPALRFHHVLIRDAAYRRVLKETRAELHERVADWITSRAPDAVEHDETIGWHLEQAHQNLRELGPLDDHGRSLGERAARHLGAAGRRALAREDLALAAGLLGRAFDRLEVADAGRAELALEWCEALLSGGDVAPATRAIDELARLATGSDRLRAWHTCFAGQLAALIDPQSLRATADGVAQAAEVLAAAGDAAGEAKAHAVHASALSRLGEVGACETALDQALAAARRARDRRRANAVLAGAPVAALWGPSPVTRASGRCLDVVRVLRITQGAPTVEAVALRCQAVLETLRGRGDAARRMIASSRSMVEELGIAQQLFEADVFAGLIELLEGDAEAAERNLRSAYDGLRERGLGIDAARAAALLGRALLAQGRAAEAEALSHESEALAGDDLKAAIAWRGVRAEALARHGEATIAVELAREAVAIAAATDALLDHADARQALATALRAKGHDAEADVEETRAIELWEAKGATLLLERVERAGTQDVPTISDRAQLRRFERYHIRDNGATAHMLRVDAALVARDAHALLDAYLPEVEVVHHVTGSILGRDASLEYFRTMIEQSAMLSFTHDVFASFGESLVLGRAAFRATEVAVDDLLLGAVETIQISVIEADASGRASRVEVFAEGHLTEAIARLYERHAELTPAGPEGARAAMTARAVAAVLPADIDAIADVLAPDIEYADHRPLGFGSARGAAAYLRGLRSLFDGMRGTLATDNELIVATPDALLLRRRTAGILRDGGGAFEHPMLMLWAFGDDGRITHIEMFEPDRDAEALARVDELSQAPAGTDLVEDAVTRAGAEPQHAAVAAGMREFSRAFAARDWSALAARCAREIEIRDHRRLGWETLHGPAAYIEALRALVELAPDVVLRLDHVEMCAQGYFVVTVWSGTRDGGAFEEPSWMVAELDAEGRILHFDQYELERTEEARARFDVLGATRP